MKKKKKKVLKSERGLKIKEFKKALKILILGASKRPSIEQADCFLFLNGVGYSYNDFFSISAPCEKDITDFFEGMAVKAEELLKIMENFSSRAFISEEDGFTTFSDSSTVAGISKEEISINMKTRLEMLQYPDDIEEDWKEIDEENSFIKGGDKLIDGISLCLGAASKDSSLPVFNSIIFNGNYIWATDRVRVSQYDLGFSFSSSPFSIPLVSAVALTSIDPPTHYFFGDSWLHFLNENTDLIFSIRYTPLFGEEMKDVDIIPELFELADDEHGFSTVEFPENLKDLVNSVVFMADGKMDADKLVSVEMKKQVLKVRAERQNFGFIEKSFPVSSKKNFRANMNAVFLYQILQRTGRMKIGGELALFRVGDYFKHLMAVECSWMGKKKKLEE